MCCDHSGPQQGGSPSSVTVGGWIHRLWTHRYAQRDRGLRLLCSRTIRWIPQTAACPCFAVKAGANCAAVGTGWLHSVEQAVIQQQMLEVLIDVAKLLIMSVPCPCGHAAKFAFFRDSPARFLHPFVKRPTKIAGNRSGNVRRDTS